MKPFERNCGDGIVILSMPHSGLHVPDNIKALLNKTGLQLADTDWNIDRLYKGLLPNATIIRANFHRYVIDANRDPSGQSLYPGQNTTALCPTTDFAGAPIYRDGCEPDETEIERRRLEFHAPYHAAVRSEIERVRAAHGIAILYDCHSIRSHVPYLFDGTLSDFNIGTFRGASCAAEIERAAFDVCRRAVGFSSVLNGRFKGGWTTRHYGQPSKGVHAIQMELAQAAYMEEDADPAYCPEHAENLRAHLRNVLEAIQNSAMA